MNTARRALAVVVDHGCAWTGHRWCNTRFVTWALWSEEKAPSCCSTLADAAESRRADRYAATAAAEPSAEYLRDLRAEYDRGPLSRFLDNREVGETFDEYVRRTGDRYVDGGE